MNKKAVQHHQACSVVYKESYASEWKVKMDKTLIFFAIWWPKLVFLLVVWMLEGIQEVSCDSFYPGNIAYPKGYLLMLITAKGSIVTGSYLHYSFSGTLSTSLSI